MKIHNKYSIVFFLFHFLFITYSYAQNKSSFTGTFYCKEKGIKIILDVENENILVPGYNFLGRMSGYMIGDNAESLYGTWFILSHKIKKDAIELRLTNDIGSDSQTVEFSQTSNSTFIYRTVGSNVIKRAVKRKLYSVDSSMSFIKLYDNCSTE